MSSELQNLSVVGWVGEDELGSGVIGLKQGVVPAGCVPMIAMEYDLHKMQRVAPQMEAQAAAYGKRIRLVRFTFAEVLQETESGE